MHRIIYHEKGRKYLDSHTFWRLIKRVRKQGFNIGSHNLQGERIFEQSGKWKYRESNGTSVGETSRGIVSRKFPCKWQRFKWILDCPSISRARGPWKRLQRWIISRWKISTSKQKHEDNFSPLIFQLQ